MSTPLEDWRETPEDQKALYKFMESPTGQRFLRTLEFLARPKPIAIDKTGTEAAVQGGLLYQQTAGYFHLLDQIPHLYPEAIASERKRNDAAAKVSKGRQLAPIPKPN